MKKINFVFLLLIGFSVSSYAAEVNQFGSIQSSMENLSLNPQIQEAVSCEKCKRFKTSGSDSTSGSEKNPEIQLESEYYLMEASAQTETEEEPRRKRSMHDARYNRDVMELVISLADAGIEESLNFFKKYYGEYLEYKEKENWSRVGEGLPTYGEIFGSVVFEGEVSFYIQAEQFIVLPIRGFNYGPFLSHVQGFLKELGSHSLISCKSGKEFRDLSEWGNADLDHFPKNVNPQDFEATPFFVPLAPCKYEKDGKSYFFQNEDYPFYLVRTISERIFGE